MVVLVVVVVVVKAMLLCTRRVFFFGEVPVVSMGQRYQKNALNPLMAI